jgi:orotate phosphoribosyltransferase
MGLTIPIFDANEAMKTDESIVQKSGKESTRFFRCRTFFADKELTAT